MIIYIYIYIYQQSYPAIPGLIRQEYIVQAYCVLYCYVQSIYIVQIGFFLSTQCSLVDNVLRLTSWRQDGEASAGADPGASDVELSVREAGLQQVQASHLQSLSLGLVDGHGVGEANGKLQLLELDGEV